MTQSLPDHSRADRMRRDAEATLRFVRGPNHLDDLQRIISRHSHYDPNQPRVPAGHHDGGQWTRVGGGAPSSDPEVASDVVPDDEWMPGAQYASRGARPPVWVRMGRQWVRMEHGQALRLDQATARAQDAIARVRELDPNWRPRSSAYESVEGLIRTYEAETQEAEGRIAELRRVGIGPGPFAVEFIPARGPTRSLRASERDMLNRCGSKYGCHECGTRDPGTTYSNFVGDHQPPRAWGEPMRIYPHCLGCSNIQGGRLKQFMRNLK